MMDVQNFKFHNRRRFVQTVGKISLSGGNIIASTKEWAEMKTEDGQLVKLHLILDEKEYDASPYSIWGK